MKRDVRSSADAAGAAEVVKAHGACSHRARWAGGRPARGAWRTIPVLLVLGMPAASLAVVPLLVLLGHRVIKDMVLNQVKGQLIGSLAGMGCKGARLAGLIAEAGTTHGGPGGLKLPGGLAGSMGRNAAAGPGGLAGAMGGGARGGLTEAVAGGAPGGGAAARGIGDGIAAGAVRGAVEGGAEGLAGKMSPGGKLGGGIMGGILGKLAGKVKPPIPGPSLGHAPGGMPVMAAPEGTRPTLSQAMDEVRRQQPGTGTGASLTPEQSERADEAMGQMDEAMSHPLSRAETLEVFDELAGLGVLTDSMRTEARECILLAPPGSDQAVGTSGAMLKAVVLPNLRQVKARLANLAPEEEDQLAEGVVQALHESSGSDRKQFREGLGAGFFPPAVMEKVRARLKE